MAELLPFNLQWLQLWLPHPLRLLRKSLLKLLLSSNLGAVAEEEGEVSQIGAEAGADPTTTQIKIKLSLQQQRQNLIKEAKNIKIYLLKLLGPVLSIGSEVARRHTVVTR